MVHLVSPLKKTQTNISIEQIPNGGILSKFVLRCYKLKLNDFYF